MADKDQRARRLQWLSARKSAPVSAGGVNTRRLALHRQASKEKEDEGDEIEPNNECGNLFCRQILANRYARFCEDKPMCQRYRALKLQCMANVQAEEDEEDTRPLSVVIKKKGEEEEKENEEKKKKDGIFAIPKKKKTKETSSSAVGKKKLNLNVTASVAFEEKRSNLSSPRQKDKVLRKQKKRELEKKLYEEKEEKRKSKRAKRVQEAESKRTETLVPSNSSSVQAPSASSASLADEFGLLEKKQKKSRLPLVRQSTETSSDVETGSGIDVSRIKRRRGRRASVGSVSSSSVPIGAASGASAANTRKNHATHPDQARTSAQAIRRNMNVDLVPLGIANQTNFAGGGRYVQNGNRSAAQSLGPSDPRPRPPSMTKFPAPAVVATPSALMPNASSRSAQRTQPTASPPTQRPLPPLPPQASSLAPLVSRPTARAATPLSSPVKTPVIRPNVNPPTTTATAVPGITRISTTDYMKSKKGDCGQLQPGKKTDYGQSRSSSLERSGSLTDDRASGGLPVPTYPTGPPGYHHSDSTPLASYRESFSAVDPRRQNSEGDERYQQMYLGMEGSRMKYRERLEARGEFERSTSEQREFRNFPPPRDHNSLQQQELFPTGINNSGYDYAVDTHFSSSSSLAEHSYSRGPLHEEPPPPQRVRSSHRSEQHVSNELRNFDYDDLKENPPTFSHGEDFLPQLLSVFIRKLPESLEAVFNVTKKPRKMNWYIKYVERIEHLCKEFDLHVKFDGLKVVVTVRGREWLTLQGTSTLSLHLDVIRSLRAEAVTWLRLNEEMETAYAYYRGIYGSHVNESFSFLRAWNELKHTGNYVSLPREANYFCGARLHHWNFVVGKVEIGSGSHEEKREAFRLATVSALNFLLSIGRGVHRPTVKRERIVEEVRVSARGHHRSSSRESSFSNRAHASPAAKDENNLSPELRSAGLTSLVEPPSLAAQPSNVVRPTEQLPMTSNLADTPSAEAPSTIEQSAAPSTGEPRSSAETSTSLSTVRRTEKATVVSTPVTISYSSRELAEAAEESDSCDEMSISDASDMSALISARSPRRSTIKPPTPPAGSPDSAATPAASTTPTTAPLFAPTAVISTSSITEESTLPAESKAPTAMLATFGVSAAAKDTPVTQANAAIPPRRCMMCEMIRMRKPDGERCLRCQQNGAPANGVLRTLRGP